MLPPSVLSTYREYKRDTNSIAAWLASTAKSLGFRPETLCSNTKVGDAAAASSAKLAPGGGRLKGKARQNAKKHAATLGAPKPEATGKSAATSANAKKYIIGVKDFVILSQYLVEKKAPVPHVFRSTLDRAIRARSAFGAKAAEHCQDVDDESTAKHEHFVNVLKSCRDMLQPLMPAPEHMDKKETDSEELANRFINLDIYEVAVDFENAPAPELERPAQLPSDNTSYEAEGQSSLHETMFALAALIHDMNRMRKKIRSIWRSYKEDKIDLAAAAIATNTGIDLIRNMMEDVVPLLNQHEGLRRNLQRYNYVTCIDAGFTEEQIMSGAKVTAEKEFNDVSYDISSDGFFLAYRMLEAFINVVKPGTAPLYKEGLFGKFDPKTANDRSTMTDIDKFHSDKKLLLSYLTQIMTISVATSGWCVKDEFMRGIDELKDTRKPPFYAVFAAQIFLDISYEMGTDISKAWDQTKKEFISMSNDMREHDEFHTKHKLRIPKWPESRDTALSDTRKSLDWLLTDPLHKHFTDEYKKHKVDAPELDEFRLFRMSPVMSGIFLFHFRYKYHDLGLSIAESWNSVQSMQHLYNALYQHMLVPRAWPDMDLAAVILGLDSFYAGGEAPKTATDQMKKFSVQMGFPLSGIVKIRRTKKIQPPPRVRPRGFKYVVPAMDLFRSRFLQDSPLYFTPDDLERIVDLGLREERPMKDGTSYAAQVKETTRHRNLKKKVQHEQNQPKMLRKSKNGVKNLLPEQLVQALANVANSEALEYTYPWFMLHRECWKLLMSIRDSCDDIMRKINGPSYIARNIELSDIVGLILLSNGGADNGVPNLVPLQKAADPVNTFFEKGYGSCITTNVLGKTIESPTMFVENPEEDANRTAPEPPPLGYPALRALGPVKIPERTII